MRNLTLPALIVAAVLALSACSSTPASTPATPSEDAASTSTTPAPSPTPTPTEEATAMDTIEDAAAAAGLTDFTRSTSAAPGAIAWGQGTLDGGTVKVYEFADDAGYDAFIASVAGFGITEDQLLHIGNFAFAPNDPAQLEQLRTALG